MLRLSHFYHLPMLDEATARIVSDGAGLTLVTGLDARPAVEQPAAGAVLPSGRATIFRVLIGEILAGAPDTHALIVADSADSVRVPNELRGRLRLFPSRAARDPADRIALAAAQQPGLLVIDRLDQRSATAALAAARDGIKVIAQLDSVFRGASAARQLRDLSVPPDTLDCLRWVVFVQRLPTLCPTCRRPVIPAATQLALLPADTLGPSARFFEAPGCSTCGGTGRQGDVAVFDIFRFPRGPAEREPHVLPLERYARDLAANGLLALDDLVDLGDDQLRHTYKLLNASERALNEANAALNRKVVELEAANKVLQQRTEALISLHDVGQALFATTDPNDVARRIWRHTRELTGADRILLFGRRADGTAEVLAQRGWDESILAHALPVDEIFDGTSRTPVVYAGLPPGVPRRHPDVEGGAIRAGLRVPLVSEGEQVGMLFVHSTRKARFSQAEVALIQTFANQAALALERAELFAELQGKIAELETAQAALVERERLEREMELAHEVQQSVLPQRFPELIGFTFAARNRPARQVGGDLYDIFRLDEHRVGVVIADVSGKGMPAALYMALTRSLLLAEARRERSPRITLLNVNQLLRELGEPRMFVTVFYGVLCASERALTFARAGHDYPWLFRDGQVTQLGGDGTVLGFFPSEELRLSEERIALTTRDRLVLYTDGLTDLQDPMGRRIEPEGLRAILERHANLPPAALIEATYADLADFQRDAAQYDDMTMLVVAAE